MKGLLSYLLVASLCAVSLAFRDQTVFAVVDEVSKPLLSKCIAEDLLLI